MFTGLITDVGTVTALETRGDLRVQIQTAYDMGGVELGASIACNGVCLTVVKKGDDWFAADISEASCAVTTCGSWRKGQPINLERSLKLGDEMGGHIVSGHVDTTGTITRWADVGDSTELRVRVEAGLGPMIAPKGSIAIDGVSLTVNAVEDDADGTEFSVNIIPHTRSVTAFQAASVGQAVNIEFDVLARYVARLQAYATAQTS